MPNLRIHVHTHTLARHELMQRTTDRTRHDKDGLLYSYMFTEANDRSNSVLGCLGWPFCRYVDQASSIHISCKHGPLRWTVNHAYKTVPLHDRCNKGYSRFPCGKEKCWRIPWRSLRGNNILPALPVREGKLFAHTLREDKLAALQMQTT